MDEATKKRMKDMSATRPEEGEDLKKDDAKDTKVAKDAKDAPADARDAAPNDEGELESDQKKEVKR